MAELLESLTNKLGSRDIIFTVLVRRTIKLTDQNENYKSIYFTQLSGSQYYVNTSVAVLMKDTKLFGGWFLAIPIARLGFFSKMNTWLKH